MTSRLVISPRPGVAAAAASHSLEPGTTVVSVFADLLSDAGPVGLQRIAADRATLRRAGADGRYLPYSSHADVTVGRLVSDLQRIAVDFAEVWFPAGARHDPDHSIVAEAARLLRGPFRRIVYADVDWTTPPTLTAVLADTRYAPSALPVEHVVRARREWTWDLPLAPESPPTLLELPRPAARRTGGPLLSVLTRTRGDRTESLRRALDSLAGQSSRDFELLLISPPAVSLTAEIERLPGWLQQRTRHVIDGGGKLGAILNDGVLEARGRYFVTLDDDDETLPNWVETFAMLDRRFPGRVLRTAVIKKHLDGSRGDGGFPLEFDVLEHLEDFRSPVSGLAYPLGWLDGGELLFDEELEVFEDWDYLVRAAQLFGVADAPVVTSHKLLWPNIPNTVTDYSMEQWRKCQRQIRDKIDASPLLLPPGSAKKIRDLQAQLRRTRREIERLKASRD